MEEVISTVYFHILTSCFESAHDLTLPDITEAPVPVPKLVPSPVPSPPVAGLFPNRLPAAGFAPKPAKHKNTHQ